MKKSRIMLIVLIALLLLPVTGLFAQRGGSIGGSAPASFTLRVNVNVDNAAIFINGTRQRGNAFELAPGTYQLRVSAPNYLDYAANIQLNGNRTVSVNLEPSLATLTVRTNVATALIYVNDVLQNSPRMVLPLGTHVIRIAAPGHQQYIQTINLTQDQRLAIELTPLFGYLTVELPPIIRRFTLTIDDLQITERDLLENIELLPGEYVLQLDIGGLVGMMELDVVANRRQTIEPVMNFRFLTNAQ